MRLRHDGDDGDLRRREVSALCSTGERLDPATHSTGSPYGFGPELGKEDVADFLRDRRDDVDETRNDRRAMLLGDGGLESIQVNSLACRGGQRVSERRLRCSGVTSSPSSVAPALVS